MGSRVPANLSSEPLLPSDHSATVDPAADVDEELDDHPMGSDADESSDEDQSLVRLVS